MTGNTHFCYQPLGMSSIWSGSIHREINDFGVISICQYAQSMCGGPYMFAKCTFFFPARSFLKKLLMAFLPAQLRALYVICVYFDQCYSQISPQSKISIANINKTRCLLSGIRLGDNFRHAQKMCVWDPKWYIDIDIGKNDFSVTSLSTPSWWNACITF